MRERVKVREKMKKKVKVREMMRERENEKERYFSYVICGIAPKPHHTNNAFGVFVASRLFSRVEISAIRA